MPRSSNVATSLQAQLEEFQDELVLLTRKLPSLKGSEKRLTKKAIRNLKQAIRKQMRLIKKNNKDEKKDQQQETEQILAEQGIDSRGNLANAIGGTIGALGKTAVSLFAPRGAESEDDSEARKKKNKKKDTNMLMYAGIGVGAIFLLMMLKKK